jgi:phosphatidylserine/phosphatidylglycerophosphate/cardiolipin synthase-like enzyme
LIRCLTRQGKPSPTVQLLTDLSTDNLLSGATDATALLAVVESVSATSVRYLPRLHAKVYVRDQAEALVTSGNMTDGGLSRNHELGVRILDPLLVAQVRTHVTNLAELGAPVPPAELRTVSEAARELRQRWRAAEASARKEVKTAFAEQVSQVNDALLHLRVTGRSLNAILSDTILFVLRDGPMTTEEIHREVQRIHPDLCDDTVDRVINGQRFGKKWKHHVRIAQNHLKDRGKLTLRQKRWSLVR